MRKVWLALALALPAVPSLGQVYQAGLLGFYANVDEKSTEPPEVRVKRVDKRLWFYSVPRELAVDGLALRRPSDAPWPADVVDTFRGGPMLAQWVGFLLVPAAGEYQFSLLADDFGQLRVDDQKVVTHSIGLYGRSRGGWTVNPPTVGTARLTAGMHRVTIAYVNLGGSSALLLRWRPPDAEAPAEVPATYLVHDPKADPSLPAAAQLETGPKVLSSGTAFGVRADGWFLTCQHVVSDAKGNPSILVGEREVPVEVKGSDARYDLALLKADLTDRPTVSLGDVKTARRLAEVFCFGYPLADVLGLDLSAEAGRITALRQMEGSRTIQTNASVNPGISGGPMADVRAAVIGVVNMRLEVHGAPQGVAFAVPIDYAMPLLKQIPGFAVRPAGADHDLTGPEVDERISPAVVPVVIRDAAGGAAAE
ncbi:MAG: trypsin-like peptidase domain-containing protein [Armatimonadetes bacterium]|nr:trypsin-like peptidase domain-containing protein [Armatimonadota bacterium]